MGERRRGAEDRRRGPWANPGCCRSREEHRVHLRNAVVEAASAVRRIPLIEHQDGDDHKTTALLALVDLRRLLDRWDAGGGGAA